MRNSNRILVILFGLLLAVVITATGCVSQDKQVQTDTGLATSATGQTVKTEPSRQPPASENPTAEEKPMFVDIISTTFPASPGGTPVSVFVKTKPGALCEIKVGYEGGSNEAKALTVRQADANGLVSWTWSVDSKVPLGTYPISITAKTADGNESATVEASIDIKSAEECNS